MKNRFQYVLTKAVLALFIIGITFTIGCSPTEVQVEPAESANSHNTRGSGSPTAVPTPSQQPEQEVTETAVEIDPLSDPDSILATINEFAAKQEAAFFGQPGWLFVKRTEIVSIDQGDGVYRSGPTVSIPTSELFPAESPISESWYHIDETGLYQEGLGLVTADDGVIYQHTVLFDGQWVHVTLMEHGSTYNNSRYNLQKVDLPIHYAVQLLEEIYQLPKITLTAHLSDGKYTIVRETMYEEPLVLDMPQLPAPAIGDGISYTFDPQTGQLLAEAVYYFLEDGTLHLATETTVHVEFMLELPPDRAPLYYDTVNELKNE
jgi:hypothetical protein